MIHVLRRSFWLLRGEGTSRGRQKWGSPPAGHSTCLHDRSKVTWLHDVAGDRKMKGPEICFEMKWLKCGMNGYGGGECQVGECQVSRHSKWREAVSWNEVQLMEELKAEGLGKIRVLWLLPGEAKQAAEVQANLPRKVWAGQHINWLFTFLEDLFPGISHPEAHWTYLYRR